MPSDAPAAVVTGAGSGIGRALALKLAARGDKVACLDVDADGLAGTLAEIDRAGGEAVSARCDVADPRSVEEAVASARSSLGRIRFLANVAGIGHFAHTVDVTDRMWEDVLAVNLTGTFFVTRACLPDLLDGGGAILNMASVAGLKGLPYNAAYCASKGGVIALTRSLAVELAKKDVRVNCLCPGGVQTPLLASFALPPDADPVLLGRMSAPTGQMSSPEEIAEIALFLLSDAARMITGASVSADGGTTS